jgi:RimJ/RimL family protein N-acetyltransferase
VKTRPAQPDDADAIAALHVRAWQVAYAGVVPGEYLMSMNVAERAVRRRAHIETVVPPAAIFVASDEDGVVGVANVGPYRDDDHDIPGPNTGEVYGIYVHPSHWGTGAGLALMRAAVGHLSGAGYTDIRLWVLDANPRARRFYERFGFTADGAAKMHAIDPGGDHPTQARVVRYELAVR